MATLVAGMSGDLAMKTMSDILRAMHQVSPLNPSLRNGTWQKLWVGQNGGVGLANMGFVLLWLGLTRLESRH